MFLIQPLYSTVVPIGVLRKRLIASEGIYLSKLLHLGSGSIRLRILLLISASVLFISIGDLQTSLTFCLVHPRFEQKPGSQSSTSLEILLFCVSFKPCLSRFNSFTEIDHAKTKLPGKRSKRLVCAEVQLQRQSL